MQAAPAAVEKTDEERARETMAQWVKTSDTPLADEAEAEEEAEADELEEEESAAEEEAVAEAEEEVAEEVSSRGKPHVLPWFMALEAAVAFELTPRVRLCIGILLVWHTTWRHVSTAGAVNAPGAVAVRGIAAVCAIGTLPSGCT